MKMVSIEVGLPDSILMERQDLLSKTEKIGYIARALAMFGVNKTIIFKDKRDGNEYDRDLIISLLHYIKTPPYLRKRLFPIKDIFSFVGKLPPINLPSHQVRPELQNNGEVREGMILIINGKKYADVGLKEPVRYTGKKIQGVLSLQIFKNNNLLIAKEASTEIYRGYEIEFVDDITEYIDRGSFDISLATSRYGTPASVMWKDLLNKLHGSTKIIILFGSPKSGLKDILPVTFHQKLMWVNTVEGQKVKTVRSEEALLATLSLVNLAIKLSTA